jgi:RND family efflux transporter MFP subunit
MWLIRWVPAVLAGCVLWSASGCSRQPDTAPDDVARPVKLAVVSEQVPAFVFSAAGRMEAARRAELSFDRGDVLVELPVSAGDEVKTGEQLARIDTRNLELEADARRARFEEARTSFERMERLFARAAVAQADIDRARAIYDTARAELEQVEKDIAASTLRAPFDGRIASTFIDQYQLAAPRQAVMVIHDLSSYRIRIDVPETFILRAGKAARTQMEARFDHLPGQVFPLELEEFSTEARPDTLTYATVFKMSPPAGQAILPGMSVQLDLRMLTDEESGGHGWIPESAVVSTDTQSRHAWRIDTDTMRARRTPVVLGEARDGAIQILDGLVAGDTIAVSGMHHLRDGQRIKPYTAAGNE